MRRAVIGTQCDGLLIGSRADGYSKWRNITGPTLMPEHPQGPGLACSMISCMLISANGSLWLGTPAGLSCSDDRGKTWTHYCGLDWPNKQALLPDATPESAKLASKEFLGDTIKLSEDYVTCLAEMPAGHLWIGHRERSCDELNLTTQKLELSGTADNNHTVYAIAMLPVGHRVVVATYGNGLMDFSSNGLTVQHAATVDVEASDYDLLGREIRRSYSRASGEKIATFNASYDGSDRRVSVGEDGGYQVKYVHDAAGQLLMEDRQGPVPFHADYEYDRVGNRITKLYNGRSTKYKYAADNSLISEQGDDGHQVAYAYDSCGRLIEEKCGESFIRREWDPADRLSSVTLSDGTKDQFVYDADGLRVSRHSNLCSIEYQWEGANLLSEEKDGKTVASWLTTPRKYGRLISERRGEQNFSSRCYPAAVNSLPGDKW